MAGDWIKMRSDLHTHPKVIRISSALKADRLRVIGALHAVWCLFDVHSVDGILDGYCPQTLDDMISFSGFSNEMVRVGWLEFENEALSMPRFDEHNGQSAKRRAQEASRKREARKTSASEADKMQTREEKRREEKNKDIKEKKPDGFAAPDDLNLEAWQKWVEFRKAAKFKAYQNNAQSAGRAMANLIKLAGGNESAQMQIVEQSMNNNWQGLFALKSVFQKRGIMQISEPNNEIPDGFQ